MRMDSAAASETRDFLTRHATDHLSHNTSSFASINRSDSLSCGWGILSVSFLRRLPPAQWLAAS
jgi:hypothetical protein